MSRLFLADIISSKGSFSSNIWSFESWAGTVEGWDSGGENGVKVSGLGLASSKSAKSPNSSV